LKIGKLRIIWVFLVLLAAFVIFVQCIADVGGSAIPKPISPPTAVATARVG
jgi:Na+-transporting methylmalonyl-CoA/oxaloacetate decarboxylase gamma subunit